MPQMVLSWLLREVELLHYGWVRCVVWSTLGKDLWQDYPDRPFPSRFLSFGSHYWCYSLY